MLCSDTGCQEAVRYEHLDKRSLGKLNKIIKSFVDICQGNGKINVVVSGGKIRFFEPTSRVPNDEN